MGSKASALHTLDGQGQSLSSKRGDSTINPAVESMPLPLACQNAHFLSWNHFHRSERGRGHQNMQVKHKCPRIVGGYLLELAVKMLL